MNMSEEGGFGISFTEKMFGLIVVVAGILVTYFTFTSFSALGAFTWFFGIFSMILLVVGLILMTAKTE